jgi:rod shape-determining protein MreC
MESLLNRYRNITVLLLVIMAQLVLLAFGAKNGDVPLIRVWAVTAVTPAARVLESIRGGGSGFLHNYVLLHDTNAANRRLQAERDTLKLENIFLKNQLNMAERAEALKVFQARSPSKTIAATIVGTGAGANSKVVFVDRGSVSGVQRGMAVVTPDGIVGKVIAAYPTASEVLLITDSDFAAGVVSQKSGARGILKGQGSPLCKVDYVPFEDKIEEGEWLFTSGDDRVFPRAFPVGIVKSVRPGQPFKEIVVEPAGLIHGLQDVLIITDTVHQSIPDTPPGIQPVYIAPPPGGDPKPGDARPGDAKPTGANPANLQGTEADRLRQQYKTLGEAQNHTYGDNPPGQKPPDFTKMPMKPGSVPPPVSSPQTRPAAPADVSRKSNQAAGGGPPGGAPR